ncbi:MAG: tellurite resistance/C4-dicarboxylate transporter family protein [Nitrosomonas sp.]|nr:tellurite resistance/C4-dicarboxylate transporter family protein [Nitrosomonas sp.]MCW5606863.1 tellurite resistance/C4-dicarboxylate transporter family protein [Nitrosomonas sp.]
MMMWRSVLRNGVKNFHPVYFALVMATGIVSIAFEAMDFPVIARALFALNLVFYPVLCVFLLARILFFLPDLMADLKVFKRTLLFLTFVVGTNTIGMQFILFHQAISLAICLWFIALTGWFVCGYFILSSFIAMREKSLPETVNGPTLLIVVSAVSISLLGINLLSALNLSDSFAYLIAGGFWLLGFVVYVLLITLLICRLFFRRFEWMDWDAPYWISMGTAAILTLAGSEFVMRTHLPPEWAGLREIVLWMTVLIWMIGTMWIPYLLLMDTRKFTRTGISAPIPLWIKICPWLRLGFGKEHHVYDPAAWSRVFPMGMYTAGLLALTNASGYAFLAQIASYWGWFVLFVWLLTVIGMLRSVISLIQRFPP